MGEQLPRFRWQLKRLATNPGTLATTLLELARECMDDKEILGHIAHHHNTPWLELAVLAQGMKPEVQRSIGASLNVSTAVRVIVSDNPLQTAFDETGDASGVAMDDSTLAALLSLLAHQPGPEIRERVARNGSTPVATLALLARHDFADVRIAVAKNPNTPADILRDLAREPAHVLLETNMYGAQRPADAKRVRRIRIHAAAHPNTPESTLRALADDGFEWSVAENPNAPADLLARIVKDRLDSLPIIWSRDDPTIAHELEGVFRRIGKHRNACVETLCDIAKAGFPAEVAGNPSAPAELLERILRGNEWDAEVRVSIAENPNTSIETVDRLTRDDDPRVRRAAEYRISCEIS